MRYFLLMIAVVALVGQPILAADKTPLIADPILEKAIYFSLKYHVNPLEKPKGELTEADLEKVEVLKFSQKQLTVVPKGLEKLTKLRTLNLNGNSGLTKGQDSKLRKALPNCRISSDHPLTKEESANVIEAVLRRHNKKAAGELTKADLEKVTELNLKRNQLTDVKGLEKLTQLKQLWLKRNQLTDVKVLENLTQLTKLHLVDNNLTDVKVLEKLTRLTLLALRDNQLTDVKGLENLTQLESLSLDGNPDLAKAQITELRKALPMCEIVSHFRLTKEESAKVVEKEIRRKLKKPTGELTKADYEKVTELTWLFSRNIIAGDMGLEKLTQLKTLYLNRKQLTEVKGLENLTQLKMLQLNGNQLTEVPKGLENLKQLTNLYLSNNKLTELPRGLEELRQLTEFDLGNNQLTSVKGLEELTQLTILNLRDNPDLTKVQIAELKKALPNCKIYSNPTK